MITNKINHIYETDTLDSDIQKLLHEIDIDGVSLGYEGFVNKNEPQDSIVVFVKHGSYMFGKYKRIIYDYSTNPINYPDVSSKDKFYSFKKIINRFYISKKKSCT